MRKNSEANVRIATPSVAHTRHRTRSESPKCDVYSSSKDIFFKVVQGAWEGMVQVTSDNPRGKNLGARGPEILVATLLSPSAQSIARDELKQFTHLASEMKSCCIVLRAKPTSYC